MSAPDWIAVFGLLLTVVPAVSRLFGIRARKLDRILSLTTSSASLGPNDQDVRDLLLHSRDEIIARLNSKLVGRNLALAAMGIGSLLVVAAAVIANTTPLVGLPSQLLVWGFVIAVPGVVAGFAYGRR